MKKEYSVIVEKTAYPVLFSDEKEALLAAKAAGRAVLGLWDAEYPENIPAEIPYLVEDEAQLTEEFLERLVRRFLNLPWIIAKTRRLRIREFIPGDWERISAFFGNYPRRAFGQIFIDGECPAAFVDEWAFLSYIRVQYPFYEYGIWAVEETENHELIGGCGFWDGEMGETEIGYWIFPAFQRRGYAKEAVQAVLAYARYLGKIPIYAQIREENLPSRQLAEKVQFILLPEQSQSRKLRYRYVPYY